MIGSISKVRPCGHRHHYKYSSCVNVDDFSRISRDYKNDVDANGLWFFNTDNAIDCNGLLQNAQNIVEVILNLPNNTSKILHLLRDSSVKKITLDAPNLTTLELFVYHCYNLEEFKMVDSSKVTSLSYFAETTKKWLDISGFDFSNVTNVNNAFYSNNGIFLGRKIEADFSNVEYASNGFASFVLEELKYPVDENGICIYNKGAGKQAIIDGVPQFKYNTFPKLKDGNNMFGYCKFDKKTSINIIESLPTYTNGTHKFGISIHIDHKYDPEVNVALKKLSKDYITPIEELGFTLPEEITSFKGWTLTVQWNGTATENAYPQPTE